MGDQGLQKWSAVRRQLVAILRGIRPEETLGLVTELAEAGFEAIEIPLNSPDPFKSIEIASASLGKQCLIGAGTVLTVDDVARLHDAGGELMVSPNVNGDVISCAAARGMVTLPGVFSPTEALAAVASGATGLKFFPASILGPAGIKAIQAVLPKGLPVAAVGGVSEADFARYGAVGIRAFGMGSSLYQPGIKAAECGKLARKVIVAYDQSFTDSVRQ